MSAPVAQPLDQLIHALQGLPGVGEKSAMRMAVHLLQHDRLGAAQLQQALQNALDQVHNCARCHTLSAQPICSLCLDPERHDEQLCIVETPSDLSAMERTQAYKGRYFVLMGRISPLDGLSPSDLGMQTLLERSKAPELKEVIIATSFTAEGEAHAHLLAQVLGARGLKVSRLAQGVPAGSELEYVDLATLAHALEGRRSSS